MRQGYAHQAVLLMNPDADVRAPGAAITAALCGHWQHEPPCPLAAHHTGLEQHDGEVHLRILFATEPELEDLVRQRVDAALALGRLTAANDAITQWHLQRSGCADPWPMERDHLARLAHGPTG